MLFSPSPRGSPLPFLCPNVGSGYKVTLLCSQGIERTDVPVTLLCWALWCFPIPGYWSLPTAHHSDVSEAGDMRALFPWQGQGPGNPTSWITPTLTLCCPSDCQLYPSTDLWTIYLKAPWMYSLCAPPQPPQGGGKFTGPQLLVS